MVENRFGEVEPQQPLYSIEELAIIKSIDEQIIRRPESSSLVLNVPEFIDPISIEDENGKPIGRHLYTQPPFNIVLNSFHDKNIPISQLAHVISLAAVYREGIRDFYSLDYNKEMILDPRFVNYLRPRLYPDVEREQGEECMSSLDATLVQMLDTLDENWDKWRSYVRRHLDDKAWTLSGRYKQSSYREPLQSFFAWLNAQVSSEERLRLYGLEEVLPDGYPSSSIPSQSDFLQQSGIHPRKSKSGKYFQYRAAANLLPKHT